MKKEILNLISFRKKVIILVKNTKEENFISKYKEDFKKGIAALESIPENEKLKLNLSDCFAQILEKERESFNSERENSWDSFINYLKETDDKLETSELKCAFWIVVCHCILFRATVFYSGKSRTHLLEIWLEKSTIILTLII